MKNKRDILPWTEAACKSLRGAVFDKSLNEQARRRPLESPPWFPSILSAMQIKNTNKHAI
jgi:hypothetical protein